MNGVGGRHRAAAMLAVTVFGLVAESVAYGLDDPRRWLPDMAVGLVFAACGMAAWRRERPGMLFAGVGLTWLAGTLVAPLLAAYRGPLFHLLVAHPRTRPRSWVALAAIVVVYAAALVEPIWRRELVTVAFAIVLVVVAFRGLMVAPGSARRERRAAVLACVALAAVLLGGAAARAAFPAGDAVEPSLLAYETMLIAVAIGLWRAGRGPAPAAVADLVVELGEARSQTLGARLGQALGDPTLAIAFWSASAGEYLDDAGHADPTPGPGRAATRVDRAGERFALITHDASVLRDPALVQAVASATRLSASNVALRAEVSTRAGALFASRRRLLVAADAEREQLEARLEAGPGRRLVALEQLLAGAPTTDAPSSAEPLARARETLSETLQDLRELAHGLHPREVEQDGLRGALVALADRAPIAVTVDLRVERLTRDLEATVYFVCAEGLANVVKHAREAAADVIVTVCDGVLTVAVRDRGAGGADAAGTGLRGLADRVEAFGGRLTVDSPLGEGTRQIAELPVGG